MIKAIYSADFETTVEEDTALQTKTECWSCAYAQLYNKDEYGIFGNIKDFLNYFLYNNPNIDKKSKVKNQTIILEFHNLRFDGTFILDFILNNGFKFKHVDKASDLKTREFNCIISTKNRWYLIQIKYGCCILEIRDSLKLIPFKLEQFHKAFNTEHKKLTMNYKGNYYANCEISTANKNYILNDVFVHREGLEFMFNSGHDKLTIGANAIKDIKNRIKKDSYFGIYYDDMFYNLKKIKLETEFYGFDNAEQYIRKFYKGAFCWLKPGCENKIFYKGKTLDVNSLYPYVMHSCSGNYYGFNHFIRFKGGEPDWSKVMKENEIFGVVIKCKFKLKKDHIPTVQIKNNPRFYNPTKWLETSDIKYRGKYYSRYEDPETHDIKEVKPTLYLLKPDYELFMRHYDVTDIEYLHHFYTTGEKGMFDSYINDWMEVKMHSSGGMRTEAKLFLNNGYGKLASSDDSSYLEPFLNDDKILSFIPHEEHNRPTLSILNGALVTAYARYYTITSAQKCYQQFIYADTDSLHIIGDSPKNLIVDPVKLGAWKLESEWSYGKFIRQKTYVECYDTEITKTDDETGEEVKYIYKDYPHITACGMPDKCKEEYIRRYGNDLSYFTYGLSLPGKLCPKIVKGGTVLVDRYFTLNK